MEILYPKNIKKYKGTIIENKDNYTYKLKIDKYITLKDTINKPVDINKKYKKIDKKKLDIFLVKNAIKYNCLINYYHIINDYCCVYLNKDVITGKR